MDKLTKPAESRQNTSTGSCNIFETGTVINDKWVVLELIAKGVMGEIYLAQKRTGRHSYLYKPRMIWAGIMVAVMAVSAMTIWHLIGEPGKPSPALKGHQMSGIPASSSQPPDIVQDKFPDKFSPAQNVLTADGATLHFISGGKVTLPANTGLVSEKQVKVNPFYMDETQVTNHQYVEFLNHNLSKIRVEEGVVRAEDEIWLLLGEVLNGYQPIVFKKGEFKVSNIAHASFPVFRVSGLGASAYARFYHRRLPTFAEWLYVLEDGGPGRNQPVHQPFDPIQEQDMESMHSQMHTVKQTESPLEKTPLPKLSPVINFKPNALGIRGMDKRTREWGLLIPQLSSRDKMRDAEYVVLPSNILRHPWEGFAEVGFRCVREVNLKRKQ